MSTLYLIKRGPRGPHVNVPYHPVIVCARRAMAMREAGWSCDRAWVWTHEWGSRSGGWLLQRWTGLDIDYGHVVRGFTLPDGTEAAFVHEHTGREPWPLIPGAVWWSSRKMPAWLAEMGVVYPPDRHSQQCILHAEADDGSGDLPRDHPPHWPEGIECGMARIGREQRRQMREEGRTQDTDDGLERGALEARGRACEQLADRGTDPLLNLVRAGAYYLAESQRASREHGREIDERLRSRRSIGDGNTSARFYAEKMRSRAAAIAARIDQILGLGAPRAETMEVGT